MVAGNSLLYLKYLEHSAIWDSTFSYYPGLLLTFPSPCPPVVAALLPTLPSGCLAVAMGSLLFS
jgi:hypothetical protein